MSRLIGILILLSCFAVSCPDKGPIVPTDHPGGDHGPSAFCIEFEQAENDAAVNGANAALIYRELGVTFPSNPQIINNGALCGGAGVVPGPINNQCLFQGDPDSARPERSCGPLEILFDPGLEVGRVEFDARNVGFISIPVEIVARAYDDSGRVDATGELIPVDEVSIVTRSSLGDLQPFEHITLVSDPGELPIVRVVVDYTTCPPHVVINDLCIEPKERTIPTFGQTDSGADRLVYYFDNYNDARESSIQLANLSNEEVDVHVQIWTVNSTVLECEEINFDDTYTPNDVHTYDTLNLVSNTGTISFTGNPLAGKYGFIVISKSDGPDNSLVGSMRIRDLNGFEYITNAVAPESLTSSSNKYGAVNFNNINGNQFSELIGFTYTVIAEDTVHASSGVTTIFGNPFDQVLIFDENEADVSCPPLRFSCSLGNATVGIDNSLPNPKDPDNRVCNTMSIRPGNSAGWLKLPFTETRCTDPSVTDAEGNCVHETYFVGFMGLSGSTEIAPTLNYGTFDSWWGGETSDEE
ncbi:MAG: hypothetical protein AAF462_09535 [Thermodesulfobacteriota bacterium]